MTLPHTSFSLNIGSCTTTMGKSRTFEAFTSDMGGKSVLAQRSTGFAGEKTRQYTATYTWKRRSAATSAERNAATATNAWRRGTMKTARTWTAIAPEGGGGTFERMGRGIVSVRASGESTVTFLGRATHRGR